MNTMYRTACALVLGLVLQSRLMAGAAEFTQYGFQMDTLDGTIGSTPVQVLMMFMPASDGFAPNVNVQIQPYAGSMKDYIALSKKQFADRQFKVVNEQQPDDVQWTVEYRGTMQGSDLHWYARAVQGKEKVYLISATAKESQWPQVADQLKKNVDSFKLTP